ncbi:hypothetical protein M0812_21615 [Anaeramoeba flamelloides]|uniref:Amino acid transporter transmembrane domain-containing protein n=1 Tax=Anaeramoeba flamelloides TaxID=1746091 RepID=A0AAV7YSD0_9EUKA|nr:hypothetical protein M0812_21615 [Anaeramoeba flamelloides]
MEFFKKIFTKQPQQKKKEISLLTAYAFSVNYILGIGVLSLPYAFYSAGLLLSFVLLTLVTVVSSITVMYIIEAQSRAVALDRFSKLQSQDFEFDNDTIELSTIAVFEKEDSKNNSQLNLLSNYDTEEDEILKEEKINTLSSNDDIEKESLIQKKKELKNEKKNGNRNKSQNENENENVKEKEKEKENENENEKDNENDKENVKENSDEQTESEESQKEDVSLLVTKDTTTPTTETKSNQQQKQNTNILSSKSQEEIQSLFFLRDRKYEINELCKIFFGKNGKRLYTLSIMMTLYGSLWSYAAVFGTSITMLFPIESITHGDQCMIDQKFSQSCQNNFLLYIFLFLIVITPIACLDVTEQKWLQIFLCIFRFGSLIIMIITVLIAIGTSRGSQHPHKEPPYIVKPKYFNLHGLPIIFGASAFSQMMHHSTTIITEHLKNKEKARKVFTGALSTTLTFYTVIGIVSSLYFGPKIKSLVTLNWINYSGGESSTPTWANIIKHLVILFPIIDIFSCYPLNALTLGTGLQNFFAQSSLKKTDRRSKLIKIGFRLVATIPPIIGTAIIKEIPIIIICNGIFSCLVVFLIPIALQWKSKKVSLKTFGTYQTPYSNFSSQHWVLILCAIFGGLSLIIILITSIYEEFIKK